MDQETPLNVNSMWHFCPISMHGQSLNQPTQGPLVPFTHTVPPMSPPFGAVPEVIYPTPAIPTTGIQLAYTPDWREPDKLTQANSEGMFPRTSWPGKVNFKATVVEATERGAPYSWQENEVYVHVMKRMPVTVSTTGEVPPGCVVRAYLVFRDPSLKEPVQRCAKHQSEEKCASDSPISEHWVRGHPDCCPIYGVANGVHYVDIPYDKLMGDSKNKWAVYDFQCYSSCVERTGRQRKRRVTSATRFPPLRLVLQLVFGPQFEQLGRDGIDIRVCACPGRDRGEHADRVKRKGKGKATVRPASVGERNGKHKGKGKTKTAASPPPPQLVPSTDFDMSIPNSKVQRVTISGREYYHLEMYVPVEKKEIKDAHISLDIAARTT